MYRYERLFGIYREPFALARSYGMKGLRGQSVRV